MADLVRDAGPTLRAREVTFNILISTVHASCNLAVETNPLHALIAFIFFVLLGFLQLRYPENPTPFQVHPNTMMVSIASFLVYCLLFWVKLKFAIRATHFIHTLMEVFGSLSLTSLVLMLLPDNWGSSSGFLIYTSWFVGHVLAVIIKTLQQIMRVRERTPLLPNTLMDLN